MPEVVRFGAAGTPTTAELPYELTLEGPELRHRGRHVRVRRQALLVLALLVRNAGRVVPTDAIRHEMWGERSLGWRDSLHHCVRELRRVLADDAREPRYITTVARVGYRFVGVRSDEIEREVARPRLSFAAGFAAALLLPVGLVLLCALLAR